MEVDIIVDEFDDVAIIELKTQDVILDMLNEMKNWFLIDGGCAIHPIVEYEGNKVFESTLVNQLNVILFLSKDRLTCVKKSMYFNNLNVYLTTTLVSSTCLLGLGNDFGVYFV